MRPCWRRTASPKTPIPTSDIIRVGGERKLSISSDRDLRSPHDVFEETDAYGRGLEAVLPGHPRPCVHTPKHPDPTKDHARVANGLVILGSWPTAAG